MLFLEISQFYFVYFFQTSYIREGCETFVTLFTFWTENGCYEGG